MADDQLAGTGRKGQFWLSTDDDAANLVRMRGVKSFGIPQKLREFIETTDLDSDAKEYAPDLPDTDEIEITLNFRPGSDTDVALASAADDEDPRAIYLAVPIRGVLTRGYSFLGYISYKPADEVAQGAVMESTVSLRVTGAVTVAAYADPGA